MTTRPLSSSIALAVVVLVAIALFVFSRRESSSPATPDPAVAAQLQRIDDSTRRLTEHVAALESTLSATLSD
jgi:hypothetical protein